MCFHLHAFSRKNIDVALTNLFFSNRYNFHFVPLTLTGNTPNDKVEVIKLTSVVGAGEAIDAKSQKFVDKYLDDAKQQGLR